MTVQQEFLYKYRSIDEKNFDHSRHIFTNNEVYFSSPIEFNDPFDCQFGLSFQSSAEDKRLYLERYLANSDFRLNRSEKAKWINAQMKGLGHLESHLKDKAIESMRDTINNLGVYCLSRKSDDILMWSHYADCHRGYCLKFIDGSNLPFIAAAQEIEYSVTYPIVNPIMEDDVTRLKKSLLHKAKHWEYEQEWRIIDYKNGPGVKKFPSNILVGVIFGCRMAEDHRVLIKNWCQGRASKISFYEVRVSKRNYVLEVVEI